MPPPDKFRVEIRKLESRQHWLMGHFSLEQKEIQLVGDVFESFTLAAHGLVYGKPVFSVEEETVEQVNAIVDPKEADELGTSMAVGPESVEYRGIREKALSSLNEVLRFYYGQTLDLKLRNELCWRIAAGFKQLKEGQRLSKDFKVSIPEWIALRIEDVQLGKTFNGKRGVVQNLNISFRVLSGEFAGLTFFQQIPYRFMLFKLARDIGFPVFKKLDMTDLTLAYFIGLLDTRAGTNITEFFANSTLKQRNRNLYKARRLPCLQGHNWPCAKCTMGHKYQTSFDSDYREIVGQCCRAVHPTTYTLRPCSRCKADGYFEPSEACNICLKCRNGEAYAKLKLLY